MTFAEANDEYLRWKRFLAPVAGNRLSNQRYKWDFTMRKHVLPRIGSVPWEREGACTAFSVW